MGAPKGLILVVKNAGQSNLKVGQEVDGNLNPIKQNNLTNGNPSPMNSSLPAILQANGNQVANNNQNSAQNNTNNNTPAPNSASNAGNNNLPGGIANANNNNMNSTSSSGTQGGEPMNQANPANNQASSVMVNSIPQA